MKSIVREIAIVGILAVILFFILHSMVQTFRINGTSMEPNLHDSQYVLVNKTAYWFGRDPQRGDIVVLRPPENPDSPDRIKRIIGLPGDTIEVASNGTVLINGSPLEEPYLTPHFGGSQGTWVVPPDSYFMLGDNRSVSYDSRGWGTAPRENIVGKAWLIIWSIGDWGRAPNYPLVVQAMAQQ